MNEKAERDIEKTYSDSEFVDKLRRLADAIENGDKFEIQIAKERKLAEEMAQKLEGVSCQISAKVSDGDRLYGSVTVRDIIDALATQNIVVEKRMILLKEPIKTIGSFKIPIRVYNEVEPNITVEIIPE